MRIYEEPFGLAVLYRMELRQLYDIVAHMVREDPYALLCSDVDDNGSQSADDLTKLARYVAKIINTLD